MLVFTLRYWIAFSVSYCDRGRRQHLSFTTDIAAVEEEIELQPRLTSFITSSDHTPSFTCVRKLPLLNQTRKLIVERNRRFASKFLD